MTYDTLGNLTSDGSRTFTWEHGRQLASLTSGTTIWSFAYNSDGLRTSRTDGSTKYEYVYNGSQLSQMTVTTTSEVLVFNFTYDASGTPLAFTMNGNHYYLTNLQGDVVGVLNSSGEMLFTLTYDAWGDGLYLQFGVNDEYSGQIFIFNPLLYRGYVCDWETTLYYLQSRYYDPEMGRFINADAFVSTGQGLLGFNMFAYCSNNPVSRVDPAGSSFRSTFSTTCASPGMGARYDYVIYYFHPDSKTNLDRVAINNHYVADTYFYSAGTFEELAQFVNSIPGYANNVFIYMHSDENVLSFYYAQYFSAEDIANSFNEIDINGDIYLFSCKGGRGDLASTMARSTNCTVIACEYKVSFGRGAARCGWRNYMEDSGEYGAYSWYSFSPEGNKVPYSQYWIYTVN